jgi:hypothetical protein
VNDQDSSRALEVVNRLNDMGYVFMYFLKDRKVCIRRGEESSDVDGVAFDLISDNDIELAKKYIRFSYELEQLGAEMEIAIEVAARMGGRVDVA